MEHLSFWPVFSSLVANPWLKRLGVVVIYLFIAKLADLVIDRIFKRLANKTRIRFDDHLIAVVHGPICWTIAILGFLHALVIPPRLEAPWSLVLPALGQSVVLVIWMVASFRFAGRLAEDLRPRVVSHGTIGRDLFYLLKNLVMVVIVAAGALWLLAIWRVDLTPLFASAGIAGIAVALAAKDTLANFFGGISIFADRTFKVGDYIILDNAERGEVVNIGIRSTRIKTRDDVLITIPNSILAGSKIVNESAPVPRFRIRVPVGVAYGTDLDQAEKVLLAVAEGNPAVVVEPAPRVRLRALGESSVDFELLCWVEDPSLKGLEVHRLLKAAYKALGESGITIPFPQRDLHIRTMPADSLPVGPEDGAVDAPTADQQPGRGGEWKSG